MIHFVPREYGAGENMKERINMDEGNLVKLLLIKIDSSNKQRQAVHESESKLAQMMEKCEREQIN